MCWTKCITDKIVLRSILWQNKYICRLFSNFFGQYKYYIRLIWYTGMGWTSILSKLIYAYASLIWTGAHLGSTGWGIADLFKPVSALSTVIYLRFINPQYYYLKYSWKHHIRQATSHHTTPQYNTSHDIKSRHVT